MPPRRQVGAEAAGDLRRPLPQLRRHRAARPVAREMARYVELRRHTDADGDILTQEGVRAAPEIGARELGGYDLLVSTGAQRATQTLACFLAARGERATGGVVVEAGLRSGREDRWREAYEKAGNGELEALRTADPELVAEDSAALGATLGRVLDALADGGSRPGRRAQPDKRSGRARSHRPDRGPDLQGSGRPTRRRRSGLSAGDPGLRRHLLAARNGSVLGPEL